MSRATKRKHVFNEVLQNYFTPPIDEQEIVRILTSRGNNLHEVESSNGATYLVTMPVKFRKNIWVKRGDFVIVEPIKEGNKVKAEMVRVLAKEHIKYFKKINVWPTSFDKKFELDSDEDILDKVDSLTCSDDSTSDSNSDEDDDDDDDDDDDSDEEIILSPKKDNTKEGVVVEEEEEEETSSDLTSSESPDEDVDTKKKKEHPSK